MAAMSAVEVRDRLADRFRLLLGSTPGPERQHTLRHAVAWSYDLLTDDERALLRATSVFAGGFELASIHAVAACGDAVDVLRHLDSLVRKSLVVADHTTTQHALQPVRDHPPVRRGPARGGRRAGGDPRPPCRPLRGRGRVRGGTSGTDRDGATPSTGSTPSSATCAPHSGGALPGARWRWRPTSPRTPR